MQVTITIDCDNEAFHEDDGRETEGASSAEVARILARLARDMADDRLEGFDGHPLRDINGNRVGTVRIVGAT